MYVPNLILIGVPRAGTTSLHQWLTDHPDIVGGRRKEAQYLVDVTSSLHDSDFSYHANGVAGYRSLFPNWGQVIIDATPGYLFQTTARQVLASELADCTLLVALRDPVERMRSVYRYYQNNHVVFNRKLSYEDYIDGLLCEDWDSTGNEFVDDALAHGEYVRHLDRWVADCGRSRIRLLRSDDLRENPHAVVTSICSQFGLDPSFYVDYDFSRLNGSYLVASDRLARVAAKMRARIPDGRLRSHVRRIYRRQFVRKSPIQVGRCETDERLAQHYASFNRSLADRYGVDVAGWKGCRPVPLSSFTSSRDSDPHSSCAT